MSGDPRIICFQHCRKDVKVFCFQLPKLCNFCDADLQNVELILPPFFVPYPFCSARKKPNTIVIKPTEGNFLHNYQNSLDLHIGVTDSKGYVHEYDVNGIYISNGMEWNECLPIVIKHKPDAAWRQYWDKILNTVCQQDCWTSERYNEDRNNCYSFVLFFLRSLAYPELNICLTDKTQFCADFVIPQTKIAAKYISLFRQLCVTGVKIQ